MQKLIIATVLFLPIALLLGEDKPPATKPASASTAAITPIPASSLHKAPPALSDPDKLALFKLRAKLAEAHDAYMSLIAQAQAQVNSAKAQADAAEAEFKKGMDAIREKTSVAAKGYRLDTDLNWVPDEPNPNAPQQQAAKQ